ncbi:NUDIX hydrolase [Paenibacillus harenae]|uniref:8-oxo-dGTP pyrophosphatase MutT (NUDIX family) n=1 Tax=Paenibacillus harenae TaxID=306543 RepID=A0ABT9U1Q9_PAEHA|nr:NUDIX hydrolase [Paenibacillus harenae]MDQ0060086.1 8-oxo-dGTP pyrophosphatase MutT (NUDIX family) [Paenibacillus harenae]MDQ0112364.1 8-oxo-dGTP pyrophosphatase MutT (NUDIX family) [Paenibacillus harenae]
MGYIMELRKAVGTTPIIMAGACVIVIDKQERMLLQLRADNGLWGLPGGALEPGEAMEQVARRELLEETGLIAGEIRLLDIFSGNEMYYRYPHGDEVYNVVAAYLCNEYEGELRVEEAEVRELAFFPVQALPEAINPADKPIIRSFLRQISEE